MTIPHIPLIEIQPRKLNSRLWELLGKEADGTATRVQLDELDALCRSLEAEQNNEPLGECDE